MNGNFTLIDANLSGVSSISLSNANVTLSSAQAQNIHVFLSGTLLANVTVSTPCVGFFFVINNTSGNYSLKLQANFGAGAVGSAIIIPPGTTQLIVSDTTNGVRYGAAPASVYLPGEIKAYAAASAPSGWLLCYGQAVNRNLYAALYGVIGTTYGVGDGSTTFNVPDLRGRTIAGVDNMGGSDAGILDWANAIGTTGGEQYHTLTTPETPSHNHTINDPGHNHTATLFNGGAAQGFNRFSSTYVSFDSGAPGTTDNNTTGITINNTGGGGQHNNMSPTMLLYYIIRT